MVIIQHQGTNYPYSGKITLEEVRHFVTTTFGLKDGEFTVVYVDQEGDRITLETADDYEIVGSVDEGRDNLILIITSNKLEKTKLETTTEIPILNTSVLRKQQAREDEDRKREADRRAIQEQRHRKKEENERKNAERGGQRFESQRIKQEKFLAKRAYEDEKDRNRKEKQRQRETERSKREQERREEKKDQRNKKSRDKDSSRKVEAEKDSQKIGEWDLIKFNKAVEDRVKELIPAIKQQLLKQAHQGKQVYDSNGLFVIGLEYPSTVDDVARMKAEAAQKVKMFYQAEHMKIIEKLKEEKAKAAALEKQRKRKQEKQAKEKTPQTQ